MADSATPAGLLSGHFRRVQNGEEASNDLIGQGSCSPEEIARCLGEKLALFGLDVVAPLALSW